VRPDVNLVPQIQAGTITPTRSRCWERSPALPDVPTTKEAGLPEYQSAWNAISRRRNAEGDVIAQRGAREGTNDEATRKRSDPGADLPTRRRRRRRAPQARPERDRRNKVRKVAARVRGRPSRSSAGSRWQRRKSPRAERARELGHRPPVPGTTRSGTLASGADERPTTSRVGTIRRGRRMTWSPKSSRSRLRVRRPAHARPDPPGRPPMRWSVASSASAARSTRVQHALCSGWGGPSGAKSYTREARRSAIRGSARSSRAACPRSAQRSPRFEPTPTYVRTMPT
jgi:hypothetical protein